MEMKPTTWILGALFPVLHYNLISWMFWFVSFLVGYFRKNGSSKSSSSTTRPIDVASIHLLYLFPQNISGAMLNNNENRLAWLYNCEFAVDPTMDWALLREVGMVMELERYWTKVCMGNGFTFTCNGWKNIFSIKEPIYRELSVEFIATVSFEDKTINPTYNRALVFILGGVYPKCSLR